MIYYRALNHMRDIILPETKPALEWINGRAVQKVSPKRKHALAQIQFASALNAWARATGAGMVGTEWRFHVQPPGESRRPLVPDVAFLSFSRLPYAIQLETDVPDVAPDLVIEILSPDDLIADVKEKVRVFLAAGARAVVLVDPQIETVKICERTRTVQLDRRQLFAHSSLPGFQMAIAELFTPPQPK